MSVDLDKLMLHTAYNTFKNINVQRGELIIPASIGAGVNYTHTISFDLTEDIAFLQAYSYATDYGDYFNFLDSNYHDFYRLINNNRDYLLFSSSGLLFFTINMQLDTLNKKVYFTFRCSRQGFGAVTIRHTDYRVPVTFVDYRLTN